MAEKLLLKGCPFCGGAAHWTKGDKVLRVNDAVMCLMCLAFMEGSHAPQSALEKWNTRTMDYVAARSDREVNIDGENL